MERGECKVVGSCNPQWREMVGHGEKDGLRTVQCLRGRLLAEREASKAANEEAELLMERLTQLEKLIAEEMKCKDRAEKRLKFAMKKLRSLDLVDRSGGQNMGDWSSIYSEEGKTSPNSEESLGNFAEENKGKGYGASGDGDLVTQSAVSEETSWSTVGSAQSVNMSSRDFSGEWNQSKSEIGTDSKSSSSSRSKGSSGNHRHQKEHGSDDSIASASEDTNEVVEENKLSSSNLQV